MVSSYIFHLECNVVMSLRSFYLLFLYLFCHKCQKKDSVTMCFNIFELEHKLLENIYQNFILWRIRLMTAFLIDYSNQLINFLNSHQISLDFMNMKLDGFELTTFISQHSTEELYNLKMFIDILLTRSP